MQTTIGVRSPAVPPLTSFLNPVTAVTTLWMHRDLTWQLSAREVAARYRATNLGWLWSILTPLVQLAVYTFLFSIVFKQRWGTNPNETKGEYALTIFCGMLIYNVFAEVVNRAPGLIVSCPNYVKKLIFPLEVFPVMALLSALVNLLISFGVWLVGWLLIMQTWPHATMFWLPAILLPTCLLTLGIAWFVAALGVFLRDVGPIVALVVQMLFFATPIFYRTDAVPYPLRTLIELNPLTQCIEDARRVLMEGVPPNLPWLGLSLLAALLVAQAGYAFFAKSKRAFADVL